MKRKASDISDQTLKDRRLVAIPPMVGRLVADWSSSRGTHVLSIEVPSDTEIELGGRP